MGRFRVTQEQLGRVSEGAGTLTLDHVHRQGHGSSTETNKRNSAIQLRTGFCDSIVHIVQRRADELVSVGDEQGVFLGTGHLGGHGQAQLTKQSVLHLVPRRLVPDWFLEHGTDCGLERYSHPHSLWDHEDIRENDGGIKVVAKDGLKSNLCNLLGVLAHCKEFLVRHELAIFRKVSSGLAHHPDGDPIHSFPTGCAQHALVFERRKLNVGIARQRSTRDRSAGHSCHSHRLAFLQTQHDSHHGKWEEQQRRELQRSTCSGSRRGKGGINGNCSNSSGS
mmetsp:Transcript_28033/g.47525  ORF Transcript_28033/g.47525 Transcript_28033/m.47525 type:complete len:279 (+) Transcript_28033:1406-2242(+)